MNSTDARYLALEVLLRVEAGAASDRALDGALRRARPERRDAALATELVYGVLRRRRTLDRSLSKHSSRPLVELDVAVLTALRLGVYQILFLDSVPDHAAVDSVVNATKRRKRSASGFVNAVLRAFLRDLDKGSGPAASRDGGEADGFAESLDVPDWWAARWRQRYSQAIAQEWFAANLRPAPITLRAHPRTAGGADLVAALAADGVTIEACELAPRAFTVTEGNPLRSPLLQAGAFSVRGEASQLVAALVPPRPGQTVLDACAGRGGKAIQIGEDSGARMVVASDLAAWRAAACGAAADSAGVHEVKPLVADLSRPAPLTLGFDFVMVDAPCSGLGTVRRRPELKWRNDPPRLERLARLQCTILGNAAAALADGGRLLYATCSTEPEENEQVVAKVLEQRADLSLRPVPLPPGVAVELVGDDGFFRTYPHFPQVDGFFAALLEKTEPGRDAVE